MSKNCSFHASADFLQKIGTPNDELRSPADDDVALLQPFETDRHPLSGGADHVSQVRVGKGGADDNAVAFLDAVGVGEMQKQMCEALADRARPKHLSERRIAF